MLGLVGSGITVVADALSGRKSWKKGCIYMGEYTDPDQRNVAGRKNWEFMWCQKKRFFLEHLRLEENLCLSQRMDYAGLKFPSEKQLNKIRACMEELHIRLQLREYPKNYVVLNAIWQKSSEHILWDVKS